MDDPFRESGSQVARLLRLDGEGPLYRQIADGIKRAVDRGEIPLGTVMPPERSRAGELAVSRATVVGAYERLKGQGWLESQQGSGTWVRLPDPETDEEDAASTSRLFVAEGSDGAEPRPIAADDEIVDLSVAAVMGTELVTSVLASLTVDDVASLTGHHGYVPAGLRPLREHLARGFASAGAPTADEQVLITTGAQQAISLVARQQLRPGDAVLAESPTFPGALDAFRAAGARLVPWPVDEHGVRTDLLEELLERIGPRLAYLTPHFHNPTGAVLPLERREQLLELAARTQLTVLEDTTLADLHLDLDREETPPPLYALAGAETVVTIGSTAKMFWAGLRVGWLRLPSDAVARAVAAKTVQDLGTGLMGQLLALRLLERADDILAERRAELVPRRDHLCELLTRRLPDWRWTRPAGGLSLWVELPHGNADEFAELATRHGVAIVPGTALSVDAGNRRSVRLVYARPHDVLTEGVERLVAAWEAYGRTGRGSAARLLV